MSSSTLSSSLKSFFSTSLPSADPSLIEYFIGLLLDSPPGTLADLTELLAENLVINDLASNESAAGKICCDLYEGIFNKSKDNSKEKEEKKLNAPIRMADQNTAADKKKEKKDKEKEKPKDKEKESNDKDKEKDFPSISLETHLLYSQRDREAFDKFQTALHSWRSKSPEEKSAINLQTDISIENFSLLAADNTELISTADLKIIRGRRYGLIAMNGKGKTTLMRAIRWYDPCLPGLPQFLRIIHVDQEANGEERTVMQTVLDGDVERKLLLEEEQKIMKGLNNGSVGVTTTTTTNPSSSNRLNEIYNRLSELDSDSAESRCADILHGLGFTTEMQQWPTSKLSGGWRMRVKLAEAIFINPDLLLLDEPSAHLDFYSLNWLIEYLKNRFNNTLILVSHDRYLLNSVVTDIIHITDMKKLVYYRGDYNGYIKIKQERYHQQKRAFEAQEMRRAHIQSYIDTYYTEKKSSAQNNKIGQVMSKKKVLEKMELVEDPDKTESEISNKFELKFPDPSPLRVPTICSLKELKFSYPLLKGGGPSTSISTSKWLIGDMDGGITINIETKSRIGILGPNGHGKSTMMKLILGHLTPSSGYISLNTNVISAYYTQHFVDSLNLDNTPIDQLREHYPTLSVQECRNYLGRFGLIGDWATRPIVNLSGGQKSRLVFGILMKLHPHLIVLDEPSNNLDVESVDLLINAINEYKGTVICISHDQHFLSSTIKEFWAIGNGKFKVFQSLQDAKAFAY